MAERIVMKIKVALLGEGTVGKTSLLCRYVYDEFNDKYLKTFGTKTTKKVVEVVDPKDNAIIEMNLLLTDVMGQTSLQGLHEKYLFGIQAAILVTDITNRRSMECLDKWVETIDKVAGKIPMIFVANKYDLLPQAAFTVDELLALSQKYNSPCYATSAKTGENVDFMFKTLGKLLLKLRYQ